MSDFSQPMSIVLPPTITTFSRYAGSSKQRLIHQSGVPAVVTWVSGLAAYSPFYLPWPYPVTHVFWVNGSTITTTNVSMGIYNKDGVNLYKTADTAMVGASLPQQVAVTTPFVLAAGMYYFGWSCDNTTSRGFAFPGATASLGQMSGLLEEASGAFPLPATMTPVAWTRLWGAPVLGIARFSPGF